METKKDLNWAKEVLNRPAPHALTRDEVLLFWKLCGWRIEIVKDKKDPIFHHPICNCVETTRICTCLVQCNKITSISNVWDGARWYFSQLSGSPIISFPIYLNDPTAHYAIIRSVLMTEAMQEPRNETDKESNGKPKSEPKSKRK